jgi:hypothetical protein
MWLKGSNFYNHNSIFCLPSYGPVSSATYKTGVGRKAGLEVPQRIDRQHPQRRENFGHKNIDILLKQGSRDRTITYAQYKYC